MKIKLKATYCIVVMIVFSSIFISHRNFLVAGEAQQLTTHKFTESEAKEIAMHLTEVYREFIIQMTRDFLDKYQNLSDSDLSRLFDICHNSVISATDMLGWDEAKIVLLSTNIEYIIDPDNLPSYSNIAERSVVEKLRLGNKIAIETERGTHTVGVVFFDQAHANKIVVNGCMKCHAKFFTNNRKFKSADHEVKAEHLNGAIIYKIPGKSENDKKKENTNNY